MLLYSCALEIVIFSGDSPRDHHLLSGSPDLTSTRYLLRSLASTLYPLPPFFIPKLNSLLKKSYTAESFPLDPTKCLMNHLAPLLRGAGMTVMTLSLLEADDDEDDDEEDLDDVAVNVRFWMDL